VILSQIEAKLAGALMFFKKQAPSKKGLAERGLKFNHHLWGVEGVLANLKCGQYCPV
jgi:hypothetical protein